MSAAAELQKALYEALVADVGVSALVDGRVYDNVPEDAEFPYISFGPTDEIDEEEAVAQQEEHFVQIDVWDRSNARLAPAKRVSDAVKVALHRAELALPAPYVVSNLSIPQKRVFLDRDGVTAHAVLSVRAEIEWPC